MPTHHSHQADPTAHALTAAMIDNVIAWTEASVRGFAVPTYHTACLWWRAPGGSGIYLHAVILDPRAPDATLYADLRQAQAMWQDSDFSLWDCWATRDLSGLGYTRQWQSTWYLRPAATPLAAPTLPPGLTIEVVATRDQLADFETATVAGFAEPGETVAPIPPFSQHAAATLDDPGMVYLNARLAGEVVASVIAHATDTMLGIYGLSTLPAFRRRGYATALVRAAVALRPDLPTCVQPDPDTISIYTDSGFVPGGQIAAWRAAA